MSTTIDPLLKNAIDSIQIGFEDYFLIAQDNRRIISSIRNLHAGILLFIKWIIKKHTPGNANVLIMKNHTLQIDKNNILAIARSGITIGKEEIVERMKIVGITLKEQQKSHLDKIGKIRNDIEHHFSNHPKQELENSILDAFWLLKNFKEEYQNDISNLYFFGDNSYTKLITLEQNYIKQKELCFLQWIKIDFKNIQERLPDEIFDMHPGKYYINLEKIIKSKNRLTQDEVDFYSSAISFFSSLPCRACKSELSIPTVWDFSSKTEITMLCTTCNEKFTFIDVIENYLEEFYAYEIMKAGARGGICALGRCPICKNGTYLNFDKICIYCGNKNREPEDPDFEYELQIRNVNLNSDKW